MLKNVIKTYVAPCLDLELTIIACSSMGHLRDHLFQCQPTNQVLYTENFELKGQKYACAHRKQNWCDLNTGCPAKVQICHVYNRCSLHITQSDIFEYKHTFWIAKHIEIMMALCQNVVS